jgi:hypothetical protein
VEKDDLGGTPLHDAAEHGQLEALKVLLSTGVDHTAQDLDGLTAADLAQECGHSACAQFLNDYEPPPLPDIMLSSNYLLPDDDGFESISSTNLTIKSGLLNNHSAQKSISKTTTTRTVSSLQTKKQQQPSPLQQSSMTGRERRNSGSKRQERGNTGGQTYREQQQLLARNSKSDGNELKNVFAKLQSKSVAQKLREHLEEEEAEEARPAKENRRREHNIDTEPDAEGSTSALKSEH